MQVVSQYVPQSALIHATPQPIRVMPTPGTPGGTVSANPLWPQASYGATPRRPSASLTPLMSPVPVAMTPSASRLERSISALSPAGARSPGTGTVAGTMVSVASVTSRGSASSYKRSASPRISAIQDIARRDLASVGYPLIEPPDEAEPLPPNVRLAPEPDVLTTPSKPPPRPKKTIRIPKVAPPPTYQQMYIFHGADGLNMAISEHASRISTSEIRYDPVADARSLAPEPLHVGPELLNASSDQWANIYNKPPGEVEAPSSRRDQPSNQTTQASQGASGAASQTAPIGSVAWSGGQPGSVVAGTLPDALSPIPSIREPFGSLPPPFYMDGMVSYSVPKDVALYFSNAPVMLPARESFPGSAIAASGYPGSAAGYGSVMQSPRIVGSSPRPLPLVVEGPPMLSFPGAPGMGSMRSPRATPRGGWPWPENAILMDDLVSYSVPKDGIHYWGREERLPSLEDKADPANASWISSRVRYSQYK